MYFTVYLWLERLLVWFAGGVAGLMFWAGAFTHLAAAPLQVADKPQRIVSINLCTDQILIDLVPRARIAALSFLARDPSVSAIADEVGDLRLTHGGAEDVLSLRPDLILAGSYTTPATVALLKRLGKRVVIVPLANDLNAIARVVRMIALAVHEKARGEELVARFKARIAALHQRRTGGPRPSVIFYQVSSLAAGAGGLAQAAIEAAGLRNLAADKSLGAGGYLPLETLLTSPPDMIMLGHDIDAYRTVMADNLRHPAFIALMKRRPVVKIRQALLLCGTPRSAGAVEQLARAARSITVHPLRNSETGR